LGGIAGMFLAVPTAAIASVVYRHRVEWRRDDDLTNEEIPVAHAL